jgi:hypothetical protein
MLHKFKKLIVLQRKKIYLVAFIESCYSRSGLWSKRDESWNHDQQHEDSLIRAEKRVDLEREVRLDVDSKMREELEKLRAVRTDILIFIS